MAKPDVNKLYDKIFKLKDTLGEAAQLCGDIANDAENFQGEVARIITGQLNKYTIPAIKKLADEENNPGSVIALIKFLDSVPLAMARPQRNEPSSVIPESKILNPGSKGPSISSILSETRKVETKEDTISIEKMTESTFPKNK